WRDARAADRGRQGGRLSPAGHDMDRRRQRPEPAPDAAPRRDAAASPQPVSQGPRARMITRDELVALLAEVRLAPSLHNGHAMRWRLDDGRVILLGDPTRAIPVADPDGRDWRLSHGTALEGLALALARRGKALDILTVSPPLAVAATHGLVPIAQ